MDKKSKKQVPKETDRGKEGLPDLKTTPVCDDCFSSDHGIPSPLCRYITGYSRITANYLLNKTGAV
jgi:hypothetical protein